MMAGHVKLLTPNQPEESETPGAMMPALASPALPNTLEQVRELLYGDALRTQGRRLEDTKEDLHALEQRMLSRMEDIQSTVDGLVRVLRQEHDHAMRMVGGTIIEMGRQIAGLGEIRDRSTDSKIA